MTYFEMIKKIAKAQMKQYRLYVMCSILAVALFLSYASVYTNRVFMDPSIVNSVISDKIVVTSYILRAFIMCFVPLSFHTFLKGRKYEYGVMLSIGMEFWQMLFSTILENAIICLVALASGLLLGTIFSVILYGMLSRIIGISQLSWYLNIQSYKVTITLYLAAVLIATIINGAGLLKSQITDMIGDRFRAEKRLGLGRRKSTSGIKKQKHMLSGSLIRKHWLSWSVVWVLAAGVVSFSLLLSAFSVLNYGNLIRYTRQNVYDLEYCKVNEDVNQVAPEKIQEILGKNGVTVKEQTQIHFLRNGSLNVFSVSEVNEISHRNYKVGKGQMLNLFLFESMETARSRNLEPFDSMPFVLENGELNLVSCGETADRIVDKNHTMADYNIIVNEEDFSKLWEEGDMSYHAVAFMFTFADWRNSQKGVTAVENYLVKKSAYQDPTEAFYFEPVSQIEAYTVARQEAQLCLITLFSVGIIFYLASVLLIYYKLKDREPETTRILGAVFRIGLTEEELAGILKHKNAVIFLPQLVLAVLVAASYYVLDDRALTIAFSLPHFTGFYITVLIGAVLFLVQLFVTRFYTRKEYGKLKSFD